MVVTLVAGASISILLAASPPGGPATPSSVSDTTPLQGVPLHVRRGFFTETDIGAFFTVGGADHYSNAQSYLQLGVGYDLSDRIELGAHLGMGANAYDCFAAKVDGVCSQTSSFTLTFLDATAAYLYRLAERLYLTPKVAVGYTWLDPSPVVAADGSPIAKGMNVGLGVGIEYATSMDHFSIGADLLARYVTVAKVPAIAIYPRIKYTF